MRRGVYSYTGRLRTSRAGGTGVVSPPAREGLRGERAVGGWGNEKSPRISRGLFSFRFRAGHWPGDSGSLYVPATTYFPRKPSIIGSVGLNCGVRNGNRCDPDDMITRTALQTEMRLSNHATLRKV